MTRDINTLYIILIISNQMNYMTDDLTNEEVSHQPIIIKVDSNASITTKIILNINTSIFQFIQF